MFVVVVSVYHDIDTILGYLKRAGRELSPFIVILQKSYTYKNIFLSASYMIAIIDL